MRTPRTVRSIQLRRKTDCSFSTACSPAANSATHHRSGTPVRQGAHLLFLFARRALARKARLAGLSLPHFARAAARADSLRGKAQASAPHASTSDRSSAGLSAVIGLQARDSLVCSCQGAVSCSSQASWWQEVQSKLAAALLFSCSPALVGKAALPRPARACAVGSAVVRLTFLYGHARSLSLDTAGLPLTPAVQAWMPSCSSTWCMSGKQRTWPAP